MPTSSRVLLLVIILLAVGLRLPALFDNHFHADEALFASWARLIAVWRDPLLIGQAVDKPPLSFYLQALAYPFSGPVEWAARLPNIVASLLLVPLTAVFSWRLFQREASTLITALLVAMSPLAIQFSATAFTDPLLTFLILAALLFTAGDARPFWVGFLFGLAVLTKHQAWLFLPLILAVAWLGGWRARQWKRMLAGFLPHFLLQLLWQLARRGNLDLWSNQIDNFGGVRLAWSWELLPRLAAWADLWPLTLGTVLAIILFLLALPMIWTTQPVSSDRPPLVDRLLVIFIFCYLALHWLLAIPVWDRYLLPLVPLAAVIVGRGYSLAHDQLTAVSQRTNARLLVTTVPLLLLFFVAIQAPVALAARRGEYPVGGQPGADHGAWQVAGYLDQAPYGTVLYDHWYSWHWRYAFIDKGVYTNWFEGPTDLIEDLEAFAQTPGRRYLVVPDRQSAVPVLRAVEQAGFQLLPQLHTEAQPGMILYRIKPT